MTSKRCICLNPKNSKVTSRMLNKLKEKFSQKQVCFANVQKFKYLTLRKLSQTYCAGNKQNKVFHLYVHNLKYIPNKLNALFTIAI